MEVLSFNFKTDLNDINIDHSERFIAALTRLSRFARGEAESPFSDIHAYPSTDLNIKFTPPGNIDLDQEEYLDYLNMATKKGLRNRMQGDLELLISLINNYGLKLARSDVVIIRRTCILLIQKPWESDEHISRLITRLLSISNGTLNLLVEG